MSKRIDLTGQKFGRLTVLKTFKGDDGYTWNECICDCNGINIKLVKSENLKGRHTKSCGCVKQEQLSKLHSKKTNNSENVSKYSKHPCHKKLRTVWRVMKHRCYNENYKGYENYGAKGVTICQEWLDDYDLFFEWSLENGYEIGLSIDRIDFTKEYSPENCRWATRDTQANNTSTNVWIEYDGEKYTIAQLSRIFNCSTGSIQSRIKDGVYVPLMLFKFKNMFITIGEETMPIYEFANKYNIEERLIRDRYNAGKRGFDLIKQVDFKNNNKKLTVELGNFKIGDMVKYISKSGKDEDIGEIRCFYENDMLVRIKIGKNKFKKVNIKFITLIERPSEIK